VILVIGSGVTGDAVARWARREGKHVLVTDDDPARRPGGAVDRAAALHALDDVELVVPSPGVPPTHPLITAAEARRIPVRAEIELAADRAAAPIVAVTGTNGKTTVTGLVADMLSASGLVAVAAGNIGRPLLDAVGAPADVVVAEVSSFQLAFTEAFRPRVAVLLNLAPDHLDWHGTFEAYVRAKTRIFAAQSGDDVLVSNADDPVVARVAANAPARRIEFSTTSSAGYGLVDDMLVDGDGVELLRRAELPSGADVVNVLAAAAAGRAIGATIDGIRAAAIRLPRLPHRVATVGEAGGVRWIDDSKATNPHATAHALAGLDRVVLLAGGRNKGLDLGVLRERADRLVAVVAIGESADEVVAAFDGAVGEIRRASSMREAVRLAAARARPGDTVLLSPACASFDWYSGYEARGDDFAAEVAALTAAAESGRQ